MQPDAMRFSVLLTGIGGNGVNFMSSALAITAAKTFAFVARTESRGLSQRGGSVVSEVRFGEVPVTPVIGTGEEDLILSVDALEAVRTLPFLRKTGRLITNCNVTPPAHLIAAW